MVVYTNLKRAFIESDSTSDLVHLPREESVKVAKGGLNIFKNGNIFSSLVPGFGLLDKDIKVLNNDSIVNISKNEYNHINDVTKTNIYPFDDDNSTPGSRRRSYVLEKEVSINYGKNSENNLDFRNKIYHDNGIKLENVTDINNNLISTLLSQDEDEFKDSFIINAREFDYRGATIDVLGAIESLKRSSILDRELKGINVDVITNSKDARNRSLNIEIKRSVVDTNRIEHYSDISSTEHVFDSLQRYKNFAFEEVSQNGSTVYVANFSVNNAIREIPANDLIYLSDDNNQIFPFVDHSYELNNNTFLANNERYTISGDLDSYYKNNQNSYNMKSNNEDYIDGYLYSNVGYNIDYSQSIGIDSISYIGVLD
tara:strand:+ start:1243 stop:2352 length:1110 start_codon:yes stop_codon:yes gene_type:complete